MLWFIQQQLPPELLGIWREVAEALENGWIEGGSEVDERAKEALRDPEKVAGLSKWSEVESEREWKVLVAKK
jgi:hypothetical protein